MFFINFEFGRKIFKINKKPCKKNTVKVGTILFLAESTVSQSIQITILFMSRKNRKHYFYFKTVKHESI